jgi:uncharacterized protein (TIGR02118 family)
MVKLTLLYGHPKDTAAFERYYADTHLPLAARMKGVRRIELARVTGSPDGSQPQLYRTADLYFDDMQHFQAVMSTPEARAATGDLPNFATGGVQLLLAELDNVPST